MWRISGVAQPFAQLRVGAARGTELDAKTLPMLELHLGLTGGLRFTPRVGDLRAALRYGAPWLNRRR